MISREEQDRIAAKYEVLLSVAQPNMKEGDKILLDKAFEHAKELFADRHADTGELAICHGLSLARIAVEEMGLGMSSILAALFHDSVQFGYTSIEEISRRYGKTVASLVNGFTRISELPTDKVSLQSESFRKLFLAVVDDIRVILIKLAHRLHDMRIIEKLPPEKQIRFHNEVIHIYSPIAHRLGLYRIKKELEDISMKFTQPEVYQKIAQQLRATESKRNVFINEFVAPVQRELYKQGFRFDIKGRPKSIPSIWNKMERQEVEFEQVFDLFAVRIIIDSSQENEKADCWRVYSIVTNIYQPNPKRLRDWISTPKASGYESLHTTVKGPSEHWVEVQIRTSRMDEIAEKGQAAHWKYKEFVSGEDKDEWLNQVRDIIEHPEQIDFDEGHAQHLDKSAEDVFVFTPDGDLKELPAGATVLDFAFEIHTNVGYSCTGAKLNNKIVPLKQVLSNGDKVEILTSKIQKPKMDWLNFVTTTKAKNKIRRALKEEKFLEADKGNEILRRKFRNWKINFNDDTIDRLIKKFKLSSATDLYGMIYQEKLDLLEIKRFLSGDQPKDEDKKTALPVKEGKLRGISMQEEKDPGDVLMIDRNLDKVTYKLGKCCNPIPGDPVFGFVTISKGITIHRKNCPNAGQLLNRFGYRKVDVQWKDTDDAAAFRSVIRVTGLDRIGMMNDISQVISTDLKVNMLSVKIDAREGIFTGTIKLIIKNTRHLDELLHKLSKIPGVIRALRLD